jgi:hypothetical protein
MKKSEDLYSLSAVRQAVASREAAQSAALGTDADHSSIANGSISFPDLDDSPSNVSTPSCPPPQALVPPVGDATKSIPWFHMPSDDETAPAKVLVL